MVGKLFERGNVIFLTCSSIQVNQGSARDPQSFRPTPPFSERRPATPCGPREEEPLHLDIEQLPVFTYLKYKNAAIPFLFDLAAQPIFHQGDELH